MSDDSPGDGSPPRRSRRSRLLTAGRRALTGVLGRARRPAVPDTAEVTFVEVGGRQRGPFTCDTGETLLRVARAHGVDISSYCGGQCSCGTCRVGVEAADTALTPRTPNEAMVLGESQVRAGERLACQARLLGPVRVHLRDLY